MAHPEKREIDLAGRPAGRFVRLARLVVRVGQILFWLAVTTAALPVFAITRRSAAGAFGAAIAFLFERLGATFIKIGQIMSTRPDVFPAALIEPLTALQDRVPPFRFAEVRRAIEEDFGRKLGDIFVEIDERPIASASVAQVHRAVLHEAELPPSLATRVVAVKVRRPGIVRRAYLDEAILRAVARLLDVLPSFALLSPLEAVGLFCEAVGRQLDFAIEAENNRRFRKNFEDEPDVVFPALVDQLCSDRVLTMELIHGAGADAVEVVGADRSIVGRRLVEIILRMIAEHGFVHADLHPGNVLFLVGNRVALLDVGLVGVLDAENRRRFAQSFYYIASKGGPELARWLYEQSTSKQVSDYEAFEREITEEVATVHDRRFDEVNYSEQLVRLYAILRRHRVRLEATFTIPSVALMVVEGIARKLDSGINVTRVARPVLVSALAIEPADRGPAAELATPAAAPPTSIASGRYRLRRLLGEGARKRVYLARDTRLERDVAVALVRTEDLDEVRRTQIHLEARAVARLGEHPRIVPIYDSGEEEGVPFVVSQLMRGGTLAGRLLRASEHRLALEDSLRFADQILQALEHAHSQGVVHRDVKPENVWLTDDGFAKLGDFGLARAAGRIEADADGLTVGTALYMPPEQVLGRGIDHRSDLYSLGATLYELVTGHPPFDGDSVSEVIARHVSADPEPPSRRHPALPPALDAVVLKLLAKRPEERFESAAAVRAALRDLTTEKESTEPPIAAEVRVFVGRQEETARLQKGFAEALAGRGRLFVLVGEPGIGKTRVAELLARYAGQRGSTVLVGRAYEGEGAPAFWPWVQILRAYLAERDPARLLAELGADAVRVAQILPELRERLPEIPAAPPAEAEEARFRLFDGVTSFLKRAAAARPIFLFLDDLHWADKPSLLLLHFLARAIGDARIFVLATYRDVDVRHGHPLAEVLPSLRREPAFERVLLRGLAEAEVRALVTALAGAEVPEPFVRAIHRETEGNPFFIEETLRHLAEEGIVAEGRWQSTISPDEIGLPEGIRDVIGRRLARLGEDCRSLLAVAAVLGREFDARILEIVAGVERARRGELLEEAEAALIVEGDPRGAHHRFSHALIRETLYAGFGIGERVRLHRRIAAALLEVHADAVEVHLPELAHHLLEGSPGGDVARAIEFARRAAEQADARLAYEDAASFYARALRLIEPDDRRDQGLECELLIGLGTAQWRSGESARSHETLRRAAETAGRCGRVDVLARAAVAYKGEDLQTVFAFVEQDMVPLLETALAALPVEDSGLRATIMGRLAGALFAPDQQPKRDVLFERAAEMAKRVGDERALADILQSRLLVRWGVDSLPRVREDCATHLRIASKLGDVRLQFFAAYFQGSLLAETGDLASAMSWFARARSSCEHLAHLRGFVSFVRNGWAMAAADPVAAVELAKDTYEAMKDVTGSEIALMCTELQKVQILWQSGRLTESVSRWRELVAHTTAPQGAAPSMRGMYYGAVSWVWPFLAESESGARQLLSSLERPDEVDRDTFWLTRVALAVPAIERARDIERARTWYEALLPHADRAVNPGGIYCFGSVSRYLALLAKTLASYDDAVAHFDCALEIEREMPVWSARTRCEYARTLVLRAAPGDRERALELLGRSIEGARTFGLEKVAADAVALKLELEGVRPAGLGSSIEAVAASIEVKGIDVGRATAPEGTVTLLFAEMAGFLELTEAIGDDEAHRLTRVERTLLRSTLASNGGFEIEEQRGGFLFAFPKAADALRWAVATQHALAAHRNAHAEEPIHVRMGAHTGEPIKEGNRFFGKTVILAARIAQRARGDEILVSSLAHELVEPAGEFRFEGGKEVALDGFVDRQRVYSLVWDPGMHPSAARAEPPKDLPPNRFRREGDLWTLDFGERSIRMKDAKGLRYIAALLQRQGLEMHVADLANEAMPRSPSTISAAGDLAISRDLGDAGEVLDAKARDDYRTRLESLRSELEESQRMNDPGRSEALRREIDFLTQELSSAYGLGGRVRRSADSSDRARKAVSSRVLDSISRIRKQHPELGVHLGNSIRLGMFCRYDPEKPVEWIL